MQRGNKVTTWWTCSKCLSRWERLPVHEIPQTECTDMDLMNFGKHAGSSYVDVWNMDQEYCMWAVKTVEEDMANPGCAVANPALRRFASYVYDKMTQETYTADDFQMAEMGEEDL